MFPFQGLLYNCDDPTYLAAIQPNTLQMCVQSRAKVGGGAEQIVILATNFSDPGYW